MTQNAHAARVSGNSCGERRAWVVEDALRDRKGHWFEYVQTFQRGLKAEGDEVRILASRECQPDVAAVLGAEPVLPRSIWARMSDGAPKWQRLLRIPAHGLATYRAVSKLLAVCCTPHAPSSKLPADRALPDLIFVPTVLVHHLVGWIPLIKWRLRGQPSRVLLFFPNAPVVLGDDGDGRMVPDPTAKLFRWLIRLLAPEVAAGQVILGAETRPMTKALTEATGVPFTYLPHPVEIDTSADLVTRHSSPVTSENPLRFGCYGAARWEKGSDILQAAIRQVLETHPDIPATFAFQWVEGFADDQGRQVALYPWLKAHPKVEIIDGYFQDGGYARQLAATDVMILPYRQPYRLRVSRVLIEAMLLGLPVIVTRGTTLADQTDEFGAAVLCEEGSPESLAAAIVEVVGSLASLFSTSQMRRHEASRHFSVQHFRELSLLSDPR